MADMPVETAARYVLQQDVLYLVAAAATGTVLMLFGFQIVGHGHGSIVVRLFQLVAGGESAVIGLTLQAVGGIGLLYKVISDAMQ
jgi:hypothetical protein